MNKKEWKQQGFPFFSCKYLRMMARRLEQNISILYVFWWVGGVAMHFQGLLFKYVLFIYIYWKFLRKVFQSNQDIYLQLLDAKCYLESRKKNQFYIVFGVKCLRKILYMVDYANIHEYLFIFICTKIGKVFSIRTCFIFSQLVFYHIWRKNVFHRTFYDLYDNSFG